MYGKGEEGTKGLSAGKGVLYCMLSWSAKCLLQAQADLERAARLDMAGGQGWPLRARAGLGQLLRAKVAPAQRQATLQLCAAVSAVGGPQWLLTSSRNVVSNVDLPCLLIRVQTVECTLVLAELHLPAAGTSCAASD